MEIMNIDMDLQGDSCWYIVRLAMSLIVLCVMCSFSDEQQVGIAAPSGVSCLRVCHNLLVYGLHVGVDSYV